MSGLGHPRPLDYPLVSGYNIRVLDRVFVPSIGHSAFANRHSEM